MTRNGGKRMAARRRRLSGNPMARKNRYRGQTRMRDAMPTATCGDGRMLPHVIMSPRAWAKIRDVVNGNVRRECGALLIGNICRDRITGTTVILVDDAYTDGTYGSASSYMFSADMQARCVNYLYNRYGDTKHVIGTVHSHGIHDAFFSSVDDDMMTSRRSEEVHMVLSPSHETYVICFKDLSNEFHDVSLDVSLVDASFPYRRSGR